MCHDSVLGRVGFKYVFEYIYFVYLYLKSRGSEWGTVSRKEPMLAVIIQRRCVCVHMLLSVSHRSC